MALCKKCLSTREYDLTVFVCIGQMERDLKIQNNICTTAITTLHELYVVHGEVPICAHGTTSYVPVGSVKLFRYHSLRGH